ncbi:hypothetical protein [Parasporobacterium paucivorans]|uniref:Uncharacterized protein n=1 Tax=Parasporobacterium paucivorans DSM 15970 TaxID=1122934 RepID=A0A1M6CP19_9FIRM|nr:hypothetical protein [Parasporobacterium paucivorans]SHI62730.1 hypothetical protein SAMN02745691_00553 [Parasporobacterium paucivorans DSM 15970]
MERHDIDKEILFANIIAEMKMYLEMGIELLIGYRVATPWEIATCCIQEDCSYMRAYDIDDEGNILRIGFDKVTLK